MVSKSLIAIVDDDESARQAVKALVRSHGYAAMAFASAEEFLTSIDCDNVSCVIADVQMPDLGGFDLHQLLAFSMAHIPTILITDYPTERIQRRALESGVVCFLTKPFREADLIHGLHLALALGADQASMVF